MAPTMTTRNASQCTAATRGERTGGQTGRGGGMTEEQTGRVGGRTCDQGGRGGGQGDHVSNQGNIGSQNDNAADDSIEENYKNVNVKKMEAAQDISGCGDNQKAKYFAGSLTGRALTWWNSEVRTRGRKAAVGMAWEDFKALMKEEYCPSNEMQRLETEFWSHSMGGVGHAAYTDRFHELARLVPHLVTLETKRIERYIYGLAPQIRGMVAATDPSMIQSAGVLTDEAVRNGSLKRSGERR
ncbi:reverse transcriptase domain-containing protein [Tanacetum coccineum]